MTLCDGYESALCPARRQVEEAESVRDVAEGCVIFLRRERDEAVDNLHLEHDRHVEDHVRAQDAARECEKLRADSQEFERRYVEALDRGGRIRRAEKAEAQVAYERERNLNNTLCWEEEAKELRAAQVVLMDALRCILDAHGFDDANCTELCLCTACQNARTDLAQTTLAVRRVLKIVRAAEALAEKHRKDNYMRNMNRSTVGYTNGPCQCDICKAVRAKRDGDG
ncbi:hypothetical protein ES703_60085 [subsurface metagenome]